MNSNQKIDLYRLYNQSRGRAAALTDEDMNMLFNRFAEKIQHVLRPTSVLDAGCGRGYLVKALRNHGIQAWGIDSDKNDIQNLLLESQGYCKFGSLTQALPMEHYDLIILVDVIENLSTNESVKVINNLCKYCNNVLITCPPIIDREPKHINIHPSEYWVPIFYSAGFIHDMDIDLSFLTPTTLRFRKSNSSPSELLLNYEQKYRMMEQEIELRRNQSIEQIQELSTNEIRSQHQINILDAAVQNWKFENEQTQARLTDILNSTSWRFMTRIQNLRLKLIPISSRREMAMRLFLRMPSTLRREGLSGFLALTFNKAKVAIELRLARSRNKRLLQSLSQDDTYQIVEIAHIADRPPVKSHVKTVDIIICVHNALEDVRRCLDSLLEHTSHPYNLILVDDGSDEATAQYLSEFSHIHSSILLRSDEATGYTYAANRGMRASSAEFVVLLNSDTIMTPEWLDRSIACFQSDEKIGIVGPLSNTASWQSVPKIEHGGDWAINPLPEGVSPAQMAQLIASNSGRLFPEMPLLNGFCLVIRRSLLENVGLFDEENFGKGYGEEDDLVIRARKNGWKMALADDVFIYHAQSKSYSSEKRHLLSERAGKILREKHGIKVISQGIKYCQYAPILEGIRARVEVVARQNQCISIGKKFTGKKLIFILPINTPGGGANVIRSESNAMRSMGVQVDYFNLKQFTQGFETAYPDLSQSTIFGEPQNLVEISKNYDAVIATYNPTVSWLLSITNQRDHPVLGYYVQGFEPWMYVKGSQAYKTALESYTLIEDMQLFTKTEWTQEQVKKTTGRSMTVIGPSVDITLNRPRARQLPIWPEGPLKIAAMIRPESPYRKPLDTMVLLDQAAKKYKGQVEILLFGTNFDNPAFQKLPHNFPFKITGVLSPDQVANLLSQVDIFVDYSSQQAMGLTAMEAMACGCATIIPEFGGAGSYGIHEQNSLIVDTSHFDQVWGALQCLIENDELREKLQRNAIHDICQYFPEQAALNILTTLFTL